MYLLPRSAPKKGYCTATNTLDGGDRLEYIALHNKTARPDVRLVPETDFAANSKGSTTMAAKKSSETTAGENFEALTTFSPEAFKDGYEKFSKGLNSWADFQKASVEAFMASAGVVAKGFEAAASTQASFVKEQFEEGVATAKAAIASKSVQEAVELQNEYVRTAFEKNLGHATKIADHWNGVAKEAVDPLAKRYGEFVELVQSYRA